MDDKLYGLKRLEKSKLNTCSDFTAWSTWLRIFRFVADRNGVWEVFTGEEQLPEKPFTPKEMLESLKSKEGFLDKVEMTAIVDVFKLDLEQYNRSEEKFSLARQLIYHAVDNLIAHEISSEDFDHPKDAFEVLRNRFAVDPERARMQAYRHMHDMSLEDNEPVSSFLARLEECRSIIIDAGGSFNDDHMQAQISWGLPQDYHGCLNYDFNWLDGKLSLTDLRKKLFTIENILSSKDGLESTETGGNKRGGSSTNKKRCTYCRKWGHTESECWCAHPELRGD